MSNSQVFWISERQMFELHIGKNAKFKEQLINEIKANQRIGSQEQLSDAQKFIMKKIFLELNGFKGKVKGVERL